MVDFLRAQQPAATARAAQEMFARLRALGAEDRAARAELLAAGVTRARVETLYPSGFEGLVPAICAAVAEVPVHPELNMLDLRATLPGQVSYFPKPVRHSISLSAGAFHNSQAREQLMTAVLACRTAAAPLVQIENIELAPIAAAYLYFMQVQRATIADEARGQLVDELFCKLYGFLIPELAAEVAA